MTRGSLELPDVRSEPLGRASTGTVDDFVTILMHFQGAESFIERVYLYLEGMKLSRLFFAILAGCLPNEGFFFLCIFFFWQVFFSGRLLVATHIPIKALTRFFSIG